MAGAHPEPTALRADEAFALLERIDDAAFVTDAAMRVRWANGRAEAFFGVGLDRKSVV